MRPCSSCSRCCSADARRGDRTRSASIDLVESSCEGVVRATSGKYGSDVSAPIDGRDRKRLERMCRYLLRPPFAHDAVRELPDGRVRLAFKAPTRTGTTHVDLEPHRFLARLVGLVPPPLPASGPRLPRLLQPSQPPGPHPSRPRPAAAGHADPGAAVRHRRHPTVAGSDVAASCSGRQGPYQLGQAPGQGVRHRRHRLSPLRRLASRHRSDHRRRRDRPHPPRCSAAATPVARRPASVLRRVNPRPAGCEVHPQGTLRSPMRPYPQVATHRHATPGPHPSPTRSFATLRFPLRTP